MATQQHYDEQPMTLEQLEAHLKKANLDQFVQPQGAKGAAIDLGAQLQRICGIYRGIRPILQVIVNFPLIPESIKKAIRTFMSVMDGICPA